MIVQTYEAEAESAHIRPVSLPHDLTALANLIEIAFGDELGMSDSHMVQDMREAAQLGGLIWMASGARLSAPVIVSPLRSLNCAVCRSCCTRTFRIWSSVISIRA